MALQRSRQGTWNLPRSTTVSAMRRHRLAVAILGALAVIACATPAAGAVTIGWGGDVTLGSSYGHPPARGWPQLAPVAPVLRSPDLAAVN
jgi:hypothetical protein